MVSCTILTALPKGRAPPERLGGERETPKQKQMEGKSFAGEMFEWSVELGERLGECVGFSHANNESLG